MSNKENKQKATNSDTNPLNALVMPPENDECEICGGLKGTPCIFMEAGGSNEQRPAAHCEPPCVICGGEGTVDGSDYGDPLWDDDYYDPFW